MSDSFIRKMKKCRWFFDEVALKLGDGYSIIESDRNRNSAIIAPNGTEDQISYYGKPEKSIRVSNTWNWYANPKDCNNIDHIQCHTKDLPKPRPRDREDKASYPRMACSVGVYINGKYHIVYGEAYDHKTKKWYWRNQMTTEQVAEMIKAA